jgi:hypothetical protein
VVNWKEFEKDPFGSVDRLNLTWRGYDFNILHDDKGMRKVAFGFAAFCLALWALMGFDSSPLQLVYVLYHLPGLISGQISWSSLSGIYNYYYGKEMHFSAFVIYVFLFWALSRNWARVGVVKTKNMIYSFAAMFLAVGLFEFFWMYSFGIFQNQPWVYTWRWPQFRILFQDLCLALVGGLAAFYMWVDSYVIQNHKITGRLWIFPWKSWKLWLVIGLGAASAVFWIYYPFPVQQFYVVLKNGQLWHSSKLFPQTLYTINLNPGGPVNAGVWYYFRNDAVHATNTAVKFLWALATYLFFKVKRPLS